MQSRGSRFGSNKCTVEAGDLYSKCTIEEVDLYKNKCKIEEVDLYQISAQQRQSIISNFHRSRVDDAC